MAFFGLFNREKKETLDKGLEKSKESVLSKIGHAIAGKSTVDDDVLDELEEALITSDVGVETTLRIIHRVQERVKRDKYLGTSAIGKLAYQYKQAGKKVYLGAADTFRAAAVEQLCIWGERVGVPVIKQQQGSDPASVAFDTLQSAKANGADVVLIDTAGRLHNKINLMNELTKIKNVMQKVVPEAPHDVMLVLDGSTGQNAFEQARQFTAATQVTSLAITSLAFMFTVVPAPPCTISVGNWSCIFPSMISRHACAMAA